MYLLTLCYLYLYLLGTIKLTFSYRATRQRNGYYSLRTVVKMIDNNSTPFHPQRHIFL